LLLVTVEDKLAVAGRQSFASCVRHGDRRNENETRRSRERRVVNKWISGAVNDHDSDRPVVLSHVHDLALDEVIVLSRYQRRREQLTSLREPAQEKNDRDSREYSANNHDRL